MEVTRCSILQFEPELFSNMSRFLSFGTFILLCCLTYAVECEDDQCRQLDFRAALAFNGYRLLNHAIGVPEVIAEDFCGALCFIEPNCVSYNILEPSDSRPITKCELNNATYFEHPGDLVPFPNSTYRGSKNDCVKKPCPINNICQAGFSSLGYRCICEPGYFGDDCADVDECDLEEDDCDSNADCVNSPGSYDCKCKEGFSGDGRTCADIDECALQENNCTKGGANCTNTAGSFSCTCETRYFWNGHRCEADGCYNYSILSDAIRKSSYVTPSFPVLCDKPFTEGWYRFVGAAGTKMPTTRVPTFRCGTEHSGWLDGAHPSVEDSVIKKTVCFSDHPTGCKKSNIIFVKNCGSYYIYNLLRPQICNSRYCSTD